MKICLKCNLKYDDKYKFCKRCGNTLSVVQKKEQSNIKICPKCKTAYDNKYKFCKKCGSILKAKNIGQKDLPKDGLLVPSERTQLAMKNLFYLLIFVIFWAFAINFYASELKYVLYDKGFNTLSDSEDFFEMGRCYYRGSMFIPKDLGKSVDCYVISARQGNASAMYRVAYCCYFGKGVRG